MTFITRVLGSLEARLNQPWLNPMRTVYFNFRTLPFRQAVKFPVYIYGRVRFFMLNGRVRFESTSIKRGMVKIGINGDSFSLFDHTGYIQLGSPHSEIIFEGPCRIALNAKIRVVAGTLRLGEYVRIGTDTKVICNGGKISIGAFTGITFGCTVMNSSFHYTYDTQRQGYCNRTSTIELGKRNWIGNQTTILGKTKTKDDTIVGTGSLLNKDYSKCPELYPLLGGRPAKVVRGSIKRVFSPNTEVQVTTMFKDNDASFAASPEFPDDPASLIIEM